MTLDASRAQRQGLGGRLGRPPLEMPEHEYLSLTRGKPLKSAPDPLARLPLERRPLRRRFAVDEIDLFDRARSGPPEAHPPGPMLPVQGLVLCVPARDSGQGPHPFVPLIPIDESPPGSVDRGFISGRLVVGFTGTRRLPLFFLTGPTYGVVGSGSPHNIVCADDAERQRTNPQ